MHTPSHFEILFYIVDLVIKQSFGCNLEITQQSSGSHLSSNIMRRPQYLTKQLFILRSVKTSGRFFLIFVAFSEKLNLLSVSHQSEPEKEAAENKNVYS